MQSAGSLAAPLANRVYRRLFLAQVSALVGTGVTTVALALLTYELAGEAAGAVLGIALTLRIVAFVLISPVVGAYAHVLPRRQLLVGLDLVRAATVLLLPFVDALWQIYLLVFLINACSAGFTPRGYPRRWDGTRSGWRAGALHHRLRQASALGFSIPPWR